MPWFRVSGFAFQIRRQKSNVFLFVASICLQLRYRLELLENESRCLANVDPIEFLLDTTNGLIFQLFIR